MNLPKNKSNERKSKVKALFFVRKMKQKEIASRLWIAVRTVEDYVKKIKKSEGY